MTKTLYYLSAILCGIFLGVLTFMLVSGSNRTSSDNKLAIAAYSRGWVDGANAWHKPGAICDRKVVDSLHFVQLLDIIDSGR